MASQHEQAVGIDLGTTYSVIAHLDDTGRPVSIVNAEGDLTTPSTVLFDGATIVVGKEALKAMATEAAHVADCAKRDIGERAYRKVLDGNQYPPEAIQAWVLQKLRSDAAQDIGPFSKCVITVPAYFDETRRKATQDAGYMAGLEVLDIINEPTAAAVAFGFQQGYLSETGEVAKRQRILVYDLGGGTFDVTIMELDKRNFVTLATDGDVQLGGRDWDQRLVDLVADEFVALHGTDPRDDANAAGRLWRECEEAKRTLTARAKANVSFDYKGLTLKTEITRERFEDLTFDLLDRTRFTTRQTLQATGLSWDAIDRVLLVGGATRMPMIRQMLRELIGQEPDASVSADEAVAHGAALRAGILLQQSRKEQVTFRIKNVNSHSLGVVATDRTTGETRNAKLIPRNTPLPVSARRVFRTQKENQKNILVRIVEGESANAEHCSQLGKCVVRDLPPNLPAQTPIEVRFKYADNGRLEISVRVEGTDAELSHELARENSLSPEQLDIWRAYIAGSLNSTHHAPRDVC
ncbi:MAG: Hsp70 family protein [Planctomycetota bacterium]|nr:Hsp70 family protein [Planctomycetota bacterium]